MLFWSQTSDVGDGATVLFCDDEERTNLVTGDEWDGARNHGIKTTSTGHKTNVSIAVITVATKAIMTTNINLVPLPLLGSHRHSLSG